MDDEEKATAVVIGLAIAGAIGAVLFFWKKPAGYLSVVSPNQTSPLSSGGAAGWSNDERVEVVRNEEGYIDRIDIHRDVRNQ